GENGPLMENIHSGDMSRTDIEQDVVLNCRNGGSFDIHYSITPLSTLEGSGSSGTLLRRRPLRTERASFPALRSSLYKCFR
ncbi:hypothetical protein KC882_24570, partial [Enterobacter hormaechei]